MLIDISIFKNWELGVLMIMASLLYGVVQLVKMLIYGGFK